MAIHLIVVEIFQSNQKWTDRHPSPDKPIRNINAINVSQKDKHICNHQLSSAQSSRLKYNTNVQTWKGSNWHQVKHQHIWLDPGMESDINTLDCNRHLPSLSQASHDGNERETREVYFY